MTEPGEPIFTTRPTVVIELPLAKHTRILHPEQVILKAAANYYDIGALCYALRSDKRRKPVQPRGVVTSSLFKQRPKQILQIIKALSNLITGDGSALSTIGLYVRTIAEFIDWADANEMYDCLTGGEASRNALRAWATNMHERYQRQEIGPQRYNACLSQVCNLLEAMTDLQDLMQNFRKIRRSADPNGGTEPLGLHHFVHAVALNQSIFDGLCDLVLEMRLFPYKLDLPDSLGWAENHLWLFPTAVWLLPPHLWDDAHRAKPHSIAYWSYDYANGRLATVDEIEHRYKGPFEERRQRAKGAIRRALAKLNEANADAQNRWRFTLGMVAQRAFLFLFFCNTGGNRQVVRALETDGAIEASVSNQQFRTIKWRAKGKEVILVAPATFMPRLRRFMELRRYLLQDRKSPYLFFSCGNRNNMPLGPINDCAMVQHQKNLLIKIDPQLPNMGARKLRASVDDYYLRFHDSVVAAAIMGHTVETEQRKYARGSVNDQHEEMTLFMGSVSESARRQRVIAVKELSLDGQPLEQGGRCDSFGHPKAMADHPPVQPDCKDSQGCLFCNHRILVAGEDDVRKIASAAYVMEQLILGPKHEEALRPSIAKCDEDLEKIAAFPNCHAMVERVCKDVYEDGNLSPFWADKYQLFLELGIV